MDATSPARSSTVGSSSALVAAVATILMGLVARFPLQPKTRSGRAVPNPGFVVTAEGPGGIDHERTVAPGGSAP